MKVVYCAWDWDGCDDNVLLSIHSTFELAKEKAKTWAKENNSDYDNENYGTYVTKEVVEE